MTTSTRNRRRFLRDLGLGAAAVPFLAGLPSLRGEDAAPSAGRKRFVVMFSPNGTLPDEFAAQIRKEVDKMQRISRLAHITLD